MFDIEVMTDDEFSAVLLNIIKTNKTIKIYNNV